jgi:glycosyltransferase involved in cell wall biosynthesis
MTPLFTVVIPTYNRARYIGKAIRSVLGQTYKGWKLLIIDDASTDETKREVDRYLIHPGVQYYRMEENAGISAVMNKALSLVDTPYLVQVDSDDWLPPRALAILANQVKSAKRRYALYYGNMTIWRVSGTMNYQKAFHIRHRDFRNKYQFLVYNSWMVAPRCYRVSALREVGGWDTSDEYGGRIMEDRRIILRLIERYPVKWINRNLYNRTKHQHQLTDPESKQKRNRLRRMTFNYYLRRWGNRYRAVYAYRNGYLVIRKLVRVRRATR